MADPELPSPVSPEILQAGPVPEGKTLASPNTLELTPNLNLPKQLQDVTHEPISHKLRDATISGIQTPALEPPKPIHKRILSGEAPLMPVKGASDDESPGDRRLHRRLLSHRMFRPLRGAADEPPQDLPPAPAAGGGQPPEGPPNLPPAPPSGEQPEPPEDRVDKERKIELLPAPELSKKEIFLELSRLDSLDFEVRARPENEERLAQLFSKVIKLAVQDRLYSKSDDIYLEEAKLEEFEQGNPELFKDLESLWGIEHSQDKDGTQIEALREKISSNEQGKRGLSIYDQIEKVKKDIQEEKETVTQKTDFEVLEQWLSNIDLSLPKNENLPENKPAAEVKDPNEQKDPKPEEFEAAKAELEPFLYQARELGITGDINEKLTEMFRKYLSNVADHQVDNRQALKEFKNQVTDYVNDLKDDDELSLIIMAQNKARKNKDENEIDAVINEGKNEEDKTSANKIFEGVRHLYAKRALEQVKVFNFALENDLVEELLTSKRVVGDWSIEREYSKVVAEQSEKQVRRRLYEETAYQVILQARNEEEYFEAIDQYVEHLINGAGAFNAQDIINNSKLLEKAIDVYGESLGIPQPTRKQKRRASNRRVKLETASYFGVRGLTGPFTSIMDSLSEEGIETIKEIPLDPKLLLAIKLLESPQLRLLYQRTGHRGQMIGNKDAQDYLRGGMVEMLVDKIFTYEIAGKTKEEQRANAEKLAENLAYATTEDEIFSFFQKAPNSEVSPAELKESLKEVRSDIETLTVAFQQETDKKKKAELKSQLLLRIAEGKSLDQQDKTIARMKSETQRAVREGMLLFDAFGKSAKLGAPTFIMNNQNQERRKTEKGNLVPIDDVVYFLKFAILEESRKTGKSVWQISNEIDNYYKVMKKRERTKLTDQERQNEYFKAIINLRHNGYTAQINGHRFQDIVDPNNIRYAAEVRPLNNNFIAIDDNVRDRLMHPDYVEEIRKSPSKSPLYQKPDGPLIQNNLYQRIIKNTELFRPMEYTQSRQDNLNEAVDSLELSRRFESRVYRFAHIEFLLKDGELKGEKLDFGVSNLPLAVKRLSYYAAYLEANQREKVTRASDLAAQMPKLTQAFEDDMGSLSMVETILFAKYGLYDDFEIQRHYKRVGDASHVKAIVDGGIDDKYERMFGYLEKVVKTLTQLYGIWSKQSEHNPFDHQSVESVVDAAMKAFPTYTEILKSIYADFDDHRGAAGAGASRFETNQFKEDFKEWLLMKRPADRVRDQGGMTTYEDFKEIHVWNEERPRRVFLSEILNWLATEPFNALEEDPKKRISLLDEVFRRLDQSHNPSP